jgi:nucleoside-diphosphate-sugar epimerase
MRILVTGGVGFIGSHIVNRLPSAGWSVRVAHQQLIRMGVLREARPS